MTTLFAMAEVVVATCGSKGDTGTVTPELAALYTSTLGLQQSASSSAASAGASATQASGSASLATSPVFSVGVANYPINPPDAPKLDVEYKPQ